MKERKTQFNMEVQKFNWVEAVENSSKPASDLVPPSKPPASEDAAPPSLTLPLLLLATIWHLLRMSLSKSVLQPVERERKATVFTKREKQGSLSLS